MIAMTRRRRGDQIARGSTTAVAAAESAACGARRGAHDASLRAVSAICNAEKTRMISISTTDSAAP